MNTEVAKIFNRVVLSEKKLRIKLLGDSITHGVGGTGFNQNGVRINETFARNPDGFCWAKLLKEHMESQYNCEVVNNGCTGTSIEYVIAHFDELVDPEDTPKNTLLRAVLKRSPDARLIEEYSRLIAYICGEGSGYIGSIPND